MKTIAHISDLHFGKEDPAVAKGLVKDLHREQPLLLINSGDFTQRARRSQYQAASEFIKRLPVPQINIPGNHDIPFFDIFRRFLWPLTRYKRYITDEMFPKYLDDNLAVFGINTARSFTWKSGRISISQINAMERELTILPKSIFKVVVTHHPFIPPPGQENAGIDLVGRAAKALDVFDRCDVDLLLAGHLHHGYTGDIRTFYPSSKRSVIVAQAGTAISKRIRHEPNGYNIIRLEPAYIEVEVRRWNGIAFSETGKITFLLEGDRWVPQTENASFSPSS